MKRLMLMALIGLTLIAVIAFFGSCGGSETGDKQDGDSIIMTSEGDTSPPPPPDPDQEPDPDPNEDPE